MSMYRIEGNKAVFYKDQEEMAVVEPTVGMGHHPIEFGFQYLDQIFELNEAEMVRLEKEKNGGTYHIIRGRDRRELLGFVRGEDGELNMNGIYSPTKQTYKVLKMPEVGQKVSKNFNGDTYICGEIARISKTFKKITTTTGEEFYRNNHHQGVWQQYGTWTMQGGHTETRNPHI